MADERDLRPMEPLGTTEERLRRLVESFGARNEDPTFECYACQDTGYTSRQVRDKTFGQLCSVSRPCSGTPERACRIGIPIEAGLWSRAMNPHRGESAPPHGIAESYRRRLREHPHGNDLRAAVDRALTKQEKQ